MKIVTREVNCFSHLGFIYILVEPNFKENLCLVGGEEKRYRKATVIAVDETKKHTSLKTITIKNGVLEGQSIAKSNKVKIDERKVILSNIN